MNTATIITAAEWAAEKFEERTIKVANGTARIDEVLAETRVSYSEVRTEFPEMATVDARLDFQPAFEKALRRRKLLKVLKRKQTASDWYESRERA